MKESKILKSIAYLLNFILPLLIIGNIFYMVMLSENEEFLEANSIYDTQYFKNWYSFDLNVFSQQEVMKKEELENGVSKYTLWKYENQMIDCVILDTQHQRIYTNIDLENDLYQEESLKQLFQNDAEKYWICEEGVVTSNIDDLEEINNIEETTLDLANVKVYSKLSKDIPPELYFWSTFCEIAKELKRAPVVITPILFILFLVCMVYVIVAAGHKKGKEGIHLNILDEIPFDLVTIIDAGFLFIVYISCIGLGNIFYETITAFYTLIMVVLILLIVVYAVCMSWMITGVKRLKAKTFISKNIITICIRKIWKALHWILKKIVRGLHWILKKIIGVFRGIVKRIHNFNQNLYRYIGLNIRVLLVLFSFALLTTFFCILILDSQHGFVILLFLAWGAMVYFVVKKIAMFKRIKSALESIYHGDTNIELEEKDFSGELREMSKYINDISGGFSNAITKGVQAERMKTELITNVSHDIKTPLTSIINYVDLLKKEEMPNEKAKEYIAILDSKSQRLKRLTEDLVEASKASSGNLTLQFTKINLEELLNQSIGEFQDKFDAKKLEIIYHVKKEKMNKVDRLDQNGKENKVGNIDKISKITNINKSENLCIKADSRYMYRVIENLFSNIEKYALENSRVYIDLESKNNLAIVTLKNISKEKLNISEDELMQRFVRGDKSRTTEGSGLGLSIAKSLTELQKGEFEINIDGDLFKVILKFNII